MIGAPYLLTKSAGHGLRKVEFQATMHLLMVNCIHLEVEMPGDLARFRLPGGVQERLQELLDRQDSGEKLTAEEKREAEGLVEVADLLSSIYVRWVMPAL